MARYNLKANDAAEMTAVLVAAGVLIEGEEGTHTTPDATLDVIGAIHQPTGEVGEDGMPLLQALPGYHANLIADLTPEQEALLPIIPAPANPYRIFAGEEA